MRPLRSYRVTALVLRTRDLGEADRLLTLLSLERGKIAALAKGARRPRSKLAALQLFSLATLQLASGKSLEIVTQAIVRRPFFAIREEVARFAYACYFAELVDLLTEPGESNPELFELTNSAFYLLDAGFDPELTGRAFEIQLLDLSGYGPELEHCVACGKSPGAEPMGFSPSLGGIVCAGCVAGRPGLLLIRGESRRGLLALRGLHRLTGLAEAGLSFSPAARAEMERLLRTQTAYHLNREINSLRLLDRLTRGRSAG